MMAQRGRPYMGNTIAVLALIALGGWIIADLAPTIWHECLPWLIRTHLLP